MDNEGYVPISLIASFRRIKNMNVGNAQILAAVNHSSLLEMKGDSFVRTRDSPTKWIILPGAGAEALPVGGGGSVKKGVSSTDGPTMLNPDVPEFVPKYGTGGNASNTGGK